MRLIRRYLPLSALTLLCAAQASAQVYINTTRSEPYVNLVDIPGIQNVTPLTMTSADDGQAIIDPLPFSFNFLGNTFTRVNIGSNGFMTFGTDSATSLSNQAPGTTTTPNNWIAPLWDDMLHPTAANARWGIVGTAPNRAVVVEAGPATRYSASGGTLMYQIWLFEGPTRRFEYRSTGIPVNALSATIGYEGANGQPNFNAGGCTPATSCTIVPSGTTFVTFIATDPELTASVGAFPRGAFPGQQAVGQVLLRNLGVDTATSVETTLYLSTDNVYDAADVAVGTVVTDVPAGNNTVTATVTVPGGTAAADYFLIARIDSNNRWVENVESDNVAVATQRFATAHDLSTSAVAAVGTAGANPGNPISFTVTVRNDGIPYTGPVDIEVYASPDQIFDVNDLSIGVGSANLTGVTPETVQVTITLPQINPGAYYPIAALDAGRAIAELSETNNTSSGQGTFPTGPDFAITSVGLPGSATPGMPFTVTTRIDSAAVAYVGLVSYRLVISEDNTLDAADPVLGNYVVSFNNEDFLDDVQNPVLPLSLAPGLYYVIAVTDPLAQIVELNEGNNSRASAGPMANAPDFSIGAITFTPTTLDAGGTFNLTATMNSTGLPFTGQVTYRVYLSVDGTFDLADSPVHDGTISLFGLNSAPITTVVTLPRQTAPGQYRVAVVADVSGTHAEANEENNANISSTNFTLRGAELRVVSVRSDTAGFIGDDFRIELVIENQGPAPANSFRYAYYLSTNDIIRVTDTQIFLSGTTTIASGAQASFSDVVRSCASAPAPCIPVYTSTQALWVGVIADINTEVPDPSRGNNIRHGPTAVDFLFPIPDLRGEIIETATAAAAGEALAVTRVLENAGVATAAAFTYTYYLSSNPAIALDDIPIGTFNSGLSEGQDDFGIDRMQLPPDIQPGTYYLGMILDPNDQLDEVSETNNTAAGPSLPVFGASIQIVTGSLPQATLGVAYQAAVYAVGGPVGITWVVSSGSLPDGLNIDANTGLISGTPSKEGLFAFDLRAQSGTAYIDRSFSIRVTSPTVGLTIATQLLDTAVVGRPYEVLLVAVGGVTPYTWSVGTNPPGGLALSPSGLLSGTPNADGAARLAIRVVDAVGNSATKDFAINIVAADRVVAIEQNGLNEGVVDEPYCNPEDVRLFARGGVPPYSWALLSTPPPGMNLSPQGAFCGTPEEAGSFSVVVRAQDQSGLFDTSLLIFEVKGRDFAIATPNLPAGTVGQAYSASLTAVRGEAPYTFALVEGLGALPAGITLAADGKFSGTPAMAGVSAFVVQVVDAAQRIDTQALSIEVNALPVVTTPEEGCSCSSAETERGSPAALVLLGLVALLLRRRVLRGAALLLVLLPAGANAQVQVPGTPYTRTQTPITYTAITGGTVIFSSGDDSAATVNLPFPVKFYNDEVSAISVGTNCAIMMSGGQGVSLSNSAPGTTTPNGFIAPFWDDQFVSSGQGSINSLVEGVAPNRAFVIEFNNLHRYPSPGPFFSVQVRLYEGAAGRITLDYGPIVNTGSWSATMAMEDLMGGRPIYFPPSNCTSNCTGTDFAGLTNQRIELVQDPGIELVALGVTPPAFGFLGAQMPVSVNVSNLHGQAIGPFGVQIVASQTPDLAGATVIGTSSITLSAFQAATFAIQAVPPPSLGEGLFYIGLIVDSGNGVPEVNELNNTARSAGQVRLRNGAPDLAVERVYTPETSVLAGATVPLTVRVANVGGVAASNVTVGVVLSQNLVISAQDVQLTSFTVSLNPQEATEQQINVSIPATTNSGLYYLGALADPGNAVMELSESNNGRASLGSLIISGATLAIVTQRLPTGITFVPYEGRMVAVGGGTTYDWTITQGSLPAGIGLVASNGQFYGRPSRAESQTFTIQVTSDGQMASTQITLEVADPAQPLTVVSRALPVGMVDQEYSFGLVATGGVRGATLTWSATNLPGGLEMTPAGQLLGTPTGAGSSTVTISVTDGSASTNRDLLLRVRSNTSLLIDPEPLPVARFGAPYSHRMTASGGMPPIQWLVETGSLPEGVTLSAAGELSGTPMEVGRFLITIQARDSGLGTARAVDRNAYVFIVEDGTGFRITTENLPDGVRDQGYDQAIHAEGGTPPYRWALLEGALPAGLNEGVNPTTNDYRIAGQPTAEGLTTLLLQATDAQGRTAERALALRIVAPAPVITTEEETGCSCTSHHPVTGGVLPLFALLALVLAARRRR